MAIIVMEQSDLEALLDKKLKEALKPIQAKLETMEKDELIGVDEAIRCSKLHRRSIYNYIHEGFLTDYGDDKKPLFSRKECETARIRKKAGIKAKA